MNIFSIFKSILSSTRIQMVTIKQSSAGVPKNVNSAVLEYI